MGLIDAPSLFVRRRINVDEYDRMAEIGVLDPAERIELIHGEIINMPPISSRHAGTVNPSREAPRRGCRTECCRVGA